MYVQPTYEFEWATTADDLARVSEQLVGQPILSVDTETSGWQVGNEQLCLIQIGVPTERRVILVDVLKTGAPTALAPILSAPTPLIIAHNASFEERQFARYDMKVKGIRDTLTMSRQLRPDLPNHTLRTCCKLLLGLELTKQEQTSDWSVRPLSQEQVSYARLDAEVAISLYEYLAALEARASQELDLDIPGLLKEYNYVVRQRFEISREISHEMAFLQAREQKLKDVIRQKLVEGAPNYEGPLGRCTIQKVKRTEVNPELVRSTFPEFADEVIQEYVDRKRFDAVAKERGLPKNAIESVLDTVGYNDRLNIAVGDDTGLIE
jgi:DNA polymerase III epsilon subunit-like protein